MEINFDAAIEEMGGRVGIARMANEARAPSSYLFQTSVLPLRLRPGYTAEDGGLVVRNVMAGLVGMDSKFPEGGVIDVSTFREQIAKLATQVNLTEKTKRHLREVVERMMLNGQQGQIAATVVLTLINFMDKMLLQPQWDRIEYLCSRVLFEDQLNWRFNGSVLALDYGTDPAYLFPTRTGSAAYGGSASVFWTDHRNAQRRLRHASYVTIGHGNTISEIVYNEANSADILANNNGNFTIRRFRGTMERPVTDARDTSSLVSYNLEGEVWSPARDGSTVKLPFCPEGMLLYVARGRAESDIVQIDHGSTDDESIENDLELGFTHLGPTEEGNGELGIWARMYTPEDMPMQVRGQSAGNLLPVLRNRKRRAVLSTEMAA